jgi:hypothetical protein
MSLDSLEQSINNLNLAILGGGRKIVTTAGVRERLSSSISAKLVLITAETDNTNPVTVGGSTVVGALNTRIGTPLYAGESLFVPCKNLSDIYLDVITNGEGVTYTYFG